MSTLLGTICLHFPFFSSREKVWLPANDRAWRGARWEGRGEKKRRAQDRRRQKIQVKGQKSVEKKTTTTMHDRAKERRGKRSKTASDTYWQKTTNSNNTKVRLSDGVCKMLTIEPDHMIIPFPSTMAHQTLVTNYYVRGKAPLKCTWEKGRQSVGARGEKDRRERRRRIWEGRSTRERGELGWRLTLLRGQRLKTHLCLLETSSLIAEWHNCLLTGTCKRTWKWTSERRATHPHKMRNSGRERSRNLCHLKVVWISKVWDWYWLQATWANGVGKQQQTSSSIWKRCRPTD